MSDDNDFWPSGLPRVAVVRNDRKEMSYDAKMNYVRNMWSNPCDAPWVVYVETFFPAALTMAINLTCFDIGDVIRFIFKPTRLPAQASGPSRRKGRKSRKPKRLGRWWRKNTPTLEAIKDRKVSQGVHNLWVVDGLIQRGLWWWLVYDQSVEFAYNWTSLLYKTEQCQAALSPGNAYGRLDGQHVLALLGWSGEGGGQIYGRNGASINGSVCSVLSGRYACCFAAFGKKLTPETKGFKTRVRQIFPEERVLQESDEASENDTDMGTAFTRAKMAGPSVVITECFLENGQLYDVQTTTAIFGIGYPVKEPTGWTCAGFKGGTG